MLEACNFHAVRISRLRSDCRTAAFTSLLTEEEMESSWDFTLKLKEFDKFLVIIHSLYVAIREVASKY